MNTLLNEERIQNINEISDVFQNCDTKEEREWYFLYYLYITISTLTTTFYLKTNNFSEEDIKFFTQIKKDIVNLISLFFKENKNHWDIITNYEVYKEISIAHSIIKQYETLIKNQ